MDETGKAGANLSDSDDQDDARKPRQGQGLMPGESATRKRKPMTLAHRAFQSKDKLAGRRPSLSQSGSTSLSSADEADDEEKEDSNPEKPQFFTNLLERLDQRLARPDSVGKSGRSKRLQKVAGSDSQPRKRVNTIVRGGEVSALDAKRRRTRLVRAYSKSSRSTKRPRPSSRQPESQTSSGEEATDPESSSSGKQRQKLDPDQERMKTHSAIRQELYEDSDSHKSSDGGQKKRLRKGRKKLADARDSEEAEMLEIAAAQISSEGSDDSGDEDDNIDEETRQEIHEFTNMEEHRDRPMLKHLSRHPSVQVKTRMRLLRFHGKFRDIQHDYGVGDLSMDEIEDDIIHGGINTLLQDSPELSAVLEDATMPGPVDKFCATLYPRWAIKKQTLLARGGNVDVGATGSVDNDYSWCDRNTEMPILECVPRHLRKVSAILMEHGRSACIKEIRIYGYPGQRIDMLVPLTTLVEQIIIFIDTQKERAAELQASPRRLRHAATDTVGLAMNRVTQLAEDFDQWHKRKVAENNFAHILIISTYEMDPADICVMPFPEHAPAHWADEDPEGILSPLEDDDNEEEKDSFSKEDASWPAREERRQHLNKWWTRKAGSVPGLHELFQYLQDVVREYYAITPTPTLIILEHRHRVLQAIEDEPEKFSECEVVYKEFCIFKDITRRMAKAIKPSASRLKYMEYFGLYMNITERRRATSPQACITEAFSALRGSGRLMMLWIDAMESSTVLSALSLSHMLSFTKSLEWVVVSLHCNEELLDYIRYCAFEYTSHPRLASCGCRGQGRHIGGIVAAVLANWNFYLYLLDIEDDPASRPKCLLLYDVVRAAGILAKGIRDWDLRSKRAQCMTNYEGAREAMKPVRLYARRLENRLYHKRRDDMLRVRFHRCRDEMVYYACNATKGVIQQADCLDYLILQRTKRDLDYDFQRRALPRRDVIYDGHTKTELRLLIGTRTKQLRMPLQKLAYMMRNHFYYQKAYRLPKSGQKGIDISELSWLQRWKAWRTRRYRRRQQRRRDKRRRRRRLGLIS